MARRFKCFRGVGTVFLAAVLAFLISSCTNYDVPGGDEPWPKLSDFPEKPSSAEMEERRRVLFGRYGNYDKALPDPSTKPAKPPKDALRVAVIQFPRAGVPIEQMKLVTRGSTDPLYVESAPAGEAGNRRVEIYFTR